MDMADRITPGETGETGKTTPQTIRLTDYRPFPWNVGQIDLYIDLHDGHADIRARLHVCPREQPGPLVLNGEHLEFKGLWIDGEPAEAGRFNLTDTNLLIDGLSGTHVIETRCRIYPAQNTALEGLYRSGDIFCTQCEAEGFRRITWWPDRPDVMSRFTTTIEADKATCPVLLSNGNQVKAGPLPGGRHFATFEDPWPKPSYLFAAVAGNLAHTQDSFTTVSGREVALKIWVEPGNEALTTHAMDSLKRAMAWDEQRFGREYDLDVFHIVAVSSFNMGAMENKGLNIFNDRFVLADRETATDTDWFNIESIVAHEYFHNWSGNRVTCRDWFQLSLKEGFTVYRDQEFSADLHGPAVCRISDVESLRNGQFPEDAGPMAHAVRPDSYIEINNFYTMTVYEKGAELVRMLATLLGPDAFRKACDLYFARFDGQAVTCDDFVDCMEEVSGRDLGHFRKWYSRPGTPMIRAEWQYDEAQGTLTLELAQSLPAVPGHEEGGTLHIPVAIGLVGDEGEDVPVTLAGEDSPGPTTRILELTEEAQAFTFTGVKGGAVPSLLRGFSAPVRLDADYSDTDLAFLMAHDSDGFAAYEAGSRYATDVLMRLVADIQAGRDAKLDADFSEAFGAVLANAGMDHALKARMLSLPSMNWLAQGMDVVDVDAIFAAQQFMLSALGAAHGAALVRLDEALVPPAEWSASAAEMGRRSLRNLVLAYRMDGGDPAAPAIAASRFDTADNMTDRLASLRMLVDHGGSQAEGALQAFHDRWKDNALVLDKWFAIQAMSKRPDTLARVRDLMAHPAFTILNPNRLRALVRSFAGGNMVRFHDASGGGYRLLADVVLEVDGKNPQMAAGLVGPMRQWRRFDAARSALMKAELERIAGTAPISPDLYEIVSKTLA